MGLRASGRPARTSSSPSMNSVSACHSGCRPRLRDMKRRAVASLLSGSASDSVLNASLFPAPGSPSNT